MKYKLVIFDWDGTLMDSADKIVACMKVAASNAQLPIPTDRQIRDIIGLSMPNALKVLFGSLQDDDIAFLAGHYKKEYLRLDAQPCQLFPGALELLQQLNQQKRFLAVATGKLRSGLQRVWENTQSGHYFHTSRCADEAQSKPSPDMLAQILAELGLPAAQAVMIGDTSYDMAMAEALHMDRIAMTHGAHQAHQLLAHKPIALVNSLPELIHLL
jgi:phosphoglycolate phosphatase